MNKKNTMEQSVFERKKEALLVLENGRVFRGFALGCDAEATGEVVFNTSMTGYQEILTDPSYRGQMVAMTYPMIGNYGVNDEDVESGKPYLNGFIVREASPIASNWRSTARLHDYMVRHRISGIEGIDTRALTFVLRREGSMRGVISTRTGCERTLSEKARSAASMAGVDTVRYVTCASPYDAGSGRGLRVAVIDCGVKFSILRCLTGRGAQVRVFPASASHSDVLAWKPMGVLFSNGPGDPAGVPYVADTARRLIGKIPVFGICLGHQILGLALGGKTYKLKFGHHGANHPVQDAATGSVAITAQNHNYCLDEASLPASDIVITHRNLNDLTPEGIAHKSLPLFSVQFHPEAGPGPRESRSLFDRFFGMMKDFYA